MVSSPFISPLVSGSTLAGCAATEESLCNADFLPFVTEHRCSGCLNAKQETQRHF